MSTIRKMTVNAFAKQARWRWGDSKKTAHSLRRYGFTERSWGRMMAEMFIDDNGVPYPGTILTDMLEDAYRDDRPLTQADFDDMAYEELECW